MAKSQQTLQDKVKEVYSRLRSDFYLCRDDFESSGEQFNSALLFGTLTELNRGRQLLFGEYGGGKTTSAEYLNSTFNGLPLDLVKRVQLRGHPQLTHEKMVGRPHYGKMHKGEEEVVWQNFVLVGPKVFDEFNRVPEANQAVVLDGLDRGQWDYLNGFISTGKQPFFATCNYADRGNNHLIPPILDRFDVAVEAKFPGVASVVHIAQDYGNERDELLTNPELTNRALTLLGSGKPYAEVTKELEGIVAEHQRELGKTGFPIFTAQERARAEEEIKKIPFSRDAEQYFAFLAAEMNVTPKFGEKRSVDPISTENGLYLGALLTGSGSRRKEKSLVRYAKSLAWLQGKDEVDLEHVLQVAPYVLWHRINWTDDAQSKFRDHTRTDPLPLYMAKTLLNDGTPEVPGVKKRFVESREHYQRVLDLAGHGKVADALKEARQYAEDGKGHPIFLDTVRDLEG
ncbi:MAG: AAA family ATPase [Nanoarchaeota archaeon]